MPTGTIWTGVVESMSGGKPYTVNINDDGSGSCTCKNWIIQSKRGGTRYFCKHMDNVLATRPSLAERVARDAETYRRKEVERQAAEELARVQAARRKEITEQEWRGLGLEERVRRLATTTPLSYGQIMAGLVRAVQRADVPLDLLALSENDLTTLVTSSVGLIPPAPPQAPSPTLRDRIREMTLAAGFPPERVEVYIAAQEGRLALDMDLSMLSDQEVEDLVAEGAGGILSPPEAPRMPEPDQPAAEITAQLATYRDEELEAISLWARETGRPSIIATEAERLLRSRMETRAKYGDPAVFKAATARFAGWSDAELRRYIRATAAAGQTEERDVAQRMLWRRIEAKQDEQARRKREARMRAVTDGAAATGAPDGATVKGRVRRVATPEDRVIVDADTGALRWADRVTDAPPAPDVPGAVSDEERLAEEALAEYAPRRPVPHDL